MRSLSVLPRKAILRGKEISPVQRIPQKGVVHQIGLVKAMVRTRFTMKPTTLAIPALIRAGTPDFLVFALIVPFRIFLDLLNFGADRWI